MDPSDKKLKRRVPDSKRQRVSVSCDRCKLRRIRCIRLRPNDEPCAACEQLGITCQSTLPRKERVYTADYDLQHRHQALVALVQGLCPGERVESLSDIQALAGKQGIQLSQIPEEAPNSPASSTPPSIPRASGSNTLLDSISQLPIPEGALIAAPRGGYHYVGPASSYLFANTIRNLVKKSSTQTTEFGRSGHRRQQRAKEFTSASRTTALEARIQGHPVMLSAQDDPSPMSETMMHKSSPGIARSPFDHISPSSVSNSITRRVADNLPPRLIADTLIAAFFHRVHPNFTLFHRGSFQVRYEAIWSGGTALTEDPDPGWISALYMVFVLGAQAKERDCPTDSQDIQSRYLALVVREGLQRLVLTATTSNVQALALLSLYQHNAGERNTAWMLIGHAARMSVALGIQRDGQHSNYDYLERNSRRMIWWTIYLYEQSLSFVLGRPSVTSTLDISAKLPDEMVMDGGDFPPDYFLHAVKLGEISISIKRFVAAISTYYDQPDKIAGFSQIGQRLQESLDKWRSSLPLRLARESHFATSKHRRAVQLLHVTFEHLRSVIGRPFLLCDINDQLEAVRMDKRSRSNTTSLTVQLSQKSLSAARETITLLLSMAENGILEGEVWIDYYYVHHATLVLSLPFLVDPDSQLYSDRAMISTSLNVAQRSRLAPTFRILMNVSIQFAKIVGIGPDDDPSRPPSPRSLYEPLRSAESSGSTKAASTRRSDRTRDHFLFDHSNQGIPVSMERSQNDWVSDLPPAEPWSLLPIVDPTTTAQPTSLEHLLGLAPTATTSGTRLGDDPAFSDMYSFGFGISGIGGTAVQGNSRNEDVEAGDLPWDFFYSGDWTSPPP